MRLLVYPALGLALTAAALAEAPAERGRADRIASLIKQLGDDEFANRQAASAGLEAIGEPALPALRKAADAPDLETRRRARAVIAAVVERLAGTDVKSVPPPRGATVLFDGKGLDGWAARDGRSPVAWALLPGGVMEARGGDVRTRQAFAGPYRLHLEFRVPPGPDGQRGNSGVYLHGRYEVQVLDSHGQRPDPYSCGAVYGMAAPLVNACKKAGTWQSYDVEFHPPEYEEGERVSRARLTVFHNGALIHDQVEVPVDDTGMGLPGDPARPGPIMLQYHGSPVQFRNLWLVPLPRR
jgi:hypothetical protein